MKGPGVPLVAALSSSPRGDRQALEANLVPPPPPPPKESGPKPGAKLTVQVLKATGGLEAGAVQTILETGLAAWQELYVQKLQQGARLPRELNVSFTLNPGGQVVGLPAIEAALPDRDLWQQLRKALQGMRFAKTGQKSGAVTVKLVFGE
jgi:hypothetical protein